MVVALGEAQKSAHDGHDEGGPGAPTQVTTTPAKDQPSVTLLGISGGFYIVPLYAMMQAFSPRSHRARIVAANNILNAVFMVSSAIFSIIILSILKIDIKILFSINKYLLLWIA